ncbi:hypothetical protein [uncultured Jatrophihabitans sp.]|uniref:hypothetical protein n=1 Tax=uncultured Jatrophihabitans sp. TaxID=1610747 RepID=UPI0035CA4DE0
MNALRTFFASVSEANQRVALIQQPWLEDFVHWCGDGEDAVLHGHRSFRGKRSPAVTSSGWCLGMSRSARRVDEVPEHAR